MHFNKNIPAFIPESGSAVTEHPAPSANDTLTASFQSLQTKNQIKELKNIKDKDQEQAGKLLDQCAPEQLEKLSKDNKFPEHFWPVMNRRLLKDKIDTYANNQTPGLWRESLVVREK